MINHKNFWYTRGRSNYNDEAVTINTAFNLFVKKNKNIKRDYYKMSRTETSAQRLLSKWDGVDYIRGDKKKDLYATTIYANSETEKQEFIDALKEGQSGALTRQLSKINDYLGGLKANNIFTSDTVDVEKRVKIRGGKRRKS